MTATVSEEMDKARKRFARRRRWRRLSQMRWLLFVLAGLIVAGIAVWVIFFSSFLALKDVEVEGVAQISADEVVNAARVPLERPLARVDLEAIRARVENLPAVRRAEVARCWPTAVCIRVEERQPAAVVERDDQLWALSADGMLYREIAERPGNVPVIKMAPNTSADALAQAAAIVVALPGDVAVQVTTLDVRTVDEISLRLVTGATVVWGSAADSDVKAQVLGPLIAASPEASTYNVSVPGRPTTSG